MDVVRQLWGDRRSRTRLGLLIEDAERGVYASTTTGHSYEKGDDARTDKSEPPTLLKKPLHVLSP
jgi:hypothetical protein